MLDRKIKENWLRKICWHKLTLRYNQIWMEQHYCTQLHVIIRKRFQENLVFLWNIQESLFFCKHTLHTSLIPALAHFLFFHHTTCDTFPHQPPTASDNTVSVAQSGTATPGATKQLLPQDRVFKRIIYIYIYIYIYMPDQLKAKITLYVLHF